MSQNQNKLGQYTLLEKIAQGGMAEVYKAKTKDTHSLERLVVIKRILPHIAANPEYVEMLIDEAKIAVHFTHGNIAQIYDLGRIGEDYFIVMEYVDGHTLSQIFRALNEREQRMPIDILLYCLIELCHGLSYIHRKKGPNGVPLGVVHRDISPQNIILSYTGNVKIIDFGVAKADFIEGKTEDGVLKGKFAYMSPEQTRSGDLDHRSDIFSTGILLWELATGQRLFKKKSHKDTVKAVQKAKFDLASSIRFDLPKELDKILKCALARNPKHRYSDALEMGEELAKVLFKLNPQFKPIHAAKFLYKLFGPESDEKEISHSELTASNSDQKHRKKQNQYDDKTPTHKDLMITSTPDNNEEPTLKDKQPTQKSKNIRLPWNIKFNSLTFYFMITVLIFIMGSLFSVFTHWTSRSGHLILKNHNEKMQIFLNGEPLQVVNNQEIPIVSNTEHVLEISQPQYQNKTLTFKTSPSEHKIVDLTLDKEPSTGELTLVTTPQGARIYIDDVLQPQSTPATIKNLSSDKSHTIKLDLPHYKTIVKTIQIEAGKETRVYQPLEFQYAQLLITSSPGLATVFIDSKEVGQTPYFNESLTLGSTHIVTVSKEGYMPETRQIESLTENMDLHFTLKPRVE